MLLLMGSGFRVGHHWKTLIWMTEYYQTFMFEPPLYYTTDFEIICAYCCEEASSGSTSKSTIQCKVPHRQDPNGQEEQAEMTLDRH